MLAGQSADVWVRVDDEELDLVAADEVNEEIDDEELNLVVADKVNDEFDDEESDLVAADEINDEIDEVVMPVSRLMDVFEGEFLVSDSESDVLLLSSSSSSSSSGLMSSAIVPISSSAGPITLISGVSVSSWIFRVSNPEIAHSTSWKRLDKISLSLNLDFLFPLLQEGGPVSFPPMSLKRFSNWDSKVSTECSNDVFVGTINMLSERLLPHLEREIRAPARMAASEEAMAPLDAILVVGMRIAIGAGVINTLVDAFEADSIVGAPISSQDGNFSVMPCRSILKTYLVWHWDLLSSKTMSWQPKRKILGLSKS